MPARTRPTSTLPPEPAIPPRGVTAPSSSSANIEVFERAFAAADAAILPRSASPAAGTASRGLAGLIAGIGGAIAAALEGWVEPRCATCQARGTVAVEWHVAAEGAPSQLWEHCYACGARWASIRCEDFSGWC